VDHYNAVLWMRDLAEKDSLVDENTVREMHRRIVFRSQPEIGGIYSTFPRRIARSPVILPNPVKIPHLIEEYGEGLGQTEADPASFDASPAGGHSSFRRRQRTRGQAFDEPAFAPSGISACCGPPGRSEIVSRRAGTRLRA
jgi:hypothetical protein